MWKILIILCLLCLVGCDSGDEDSCLLSIFQEYGQTNVFQVSKYNYIVYIPEDNSFLYIEKRGLDDGTTLYLDITNFINVNFFTGCE